MNTAKGQAASLLQSAKETISHLEKKLSTSNSKLGWAKHKLGRLSVKCQSYNRRVERLHVRVANLNAEVEFLKGEVEHVGDDVKGQGIQVSFKVFRQLTLQLHPDFDIEALKTLITPKVVEEVVIKVEEEITAAPEVVGTNNREISVEGKAFAQVPKVVEIKDADES